MVNSSNLIGRLSSVISEKGITVRKVNSYPYSLDLQRPGSIIVELRG